MPSVQFSHSVVSDSATPWTIARQASLSITNSWSLPKLTSIESVMPSNHHILCRPLLLLPSIFPNIRVFSNESALRIRWPKYWSFSFNISPSNEHPGLIPFGHLHSLFGKMSFQFLCPFFCSSCFLDVKLYELLICWILTPYESYYLQIFSPIQ